jgi:hypothetical protein
MCNYNNISNFLLCENEFKRLSELFCFSRVGYPHMINVDKFFEQNLLDFVNIGKCQVRIVELPVVYLLLNHLMDQ